MSHYYSPFQGADRAGALGSQHTTQGIQQFGFHAEQDDVQSPSGFAPLVKPYTNIRAPPQRSSSRASFADTLSHEQSPSRGASPSPASLFSHQSSASSSYTHFSSSGASLEVGSGKESPGPCPPSHHPSFRPTSPPTRIGSPYNRPPSRIIGRPGSRPGSPLVRHQAWFHSAAVARPASRRSHQPGSQSVDHSIHHPARQMNSGIMPTAAEKELILDGQCPSPGDGHVHSMHGGNNAQEIVSAPPFSATLEQLEDAPQLPSECHTHNSAPSPDSSSCQDASTMTGLSDSDASSPGSPDSDETAPERTIRVLRTILGDEFDLRLGTCDPPEDMVSAVADCLNKIAISRRQCRLQGYLVPINAVHDSNDNNAPEPTHSPPGGTSPGDKPVEGLKKRGISDMGKDDQDDAHENERGDDGRRRADIDPNPAGDRKRAKFEAYACPFRKRNPIRFNIREWEYCAKAPFKSIPELKKHLNKYHKQAGLAFQCERCHLSFPNRENLKDHLRKDPTQMCEISSDREGSPTASSIEAVSSMVEDRFRRRKEHFDWKGIWQALFPEDHPNEIPSPDFEPPVEIHEVIQEFKGSLPELTRDLLVGIGPGGEAHRALGILNRFVDGVFERARTQALAVTQGPTSLLSTRRHTQFSPSSNLAPPFLRANAGTPSSTTTSSSGSRQRRSRTGELSTADTSGASTPASQLRDSPLLTMTTRTSVSPRGQIWGASGAYSFHGQPFLQSGFPPPTPSSLPNQSSNISMAAPVLDPTLTMPIRHHLATDGGMETQQFSNGKPPSTRHVLGQEDGSPPHSFQRRNPAQNPPSHPPSHPVPLDLQSFSQSDFDNTRNLSGHGTFPVGNGSSTYHPGAILGGQNSFSPWPDPSAQPMVTAPVPGPVPARTSQRYHRGAYVPEILSQGESLQFHGNNTGSASNTNMNNAYHPMGNSLAAPPTVHMMNQGDAEVMLASLNAMVQEQ